MQHDHVPKKLNFDVLTPPTKSTQGSGTGLRSKIAFDMFLILFIVTLSACEISVKNNDN